MNSQIYYLIFFVCLVTALVFVYKYFMNNYKKSEDKSNSMISSDNDLSVEVVSNPDIISHNELTEITEIILQNGIGEEIAFKRPHELSEKRYYEVSLTKGSKLGVDLFNAATPVIEQAHTIAELKKRAPNGLFTATEDPSKLSRMANKTYTTMVRDSDNNLVRHAGYEKIDELGKQGLMSSVSVGMQAMAAVSGQYYLHEIYSQLEDLGSKLDKLIEFHHDEKTAILKNTKIRLEEIVKRNNVEMNDIDEIRILRNGVREVFQEYHTRLNREVEEVSKYKSSSFFVKKRVKEYLDLINDINFSIQVCYESDKLSTQGELAEIAVRMKLNCQDPMLVDLYSQLNQNILNGFSVNINEHIADLFSPINLNAENIVKKGKDLLVIDKNREELLESIYNIPLELEENLADSNLKNVISHAINSRKSKQEILIMPDNQLESQKVFIPINDNNSIFDK